jgi:hypothetical protein
MTMTREIRMEEEGKNQIFPSFLMLLLLICFLFQHTPECNSITYLIHIFECIAGD